MTDVFKDIYKKTTINYKVISTGLNESVSLNPHVVIDVPNNETVLTKEHVQTFLKENPDATHVRIPEGVTTINYRAFDLCSGLKAVELPEGVTTIGRGSFDGCSDLHTLVPERLIDHASLSDVKQTYSLDKSEDVLAFNKVVIKYKQSLCFSRTSCKSNRSLYNNEQRSFIFNFLLIAKRLDLVGNLSKPVDVKNERTHFPQTLRLPPELWLYILGFVHRLDMMAINSK